MPYTTALFAAAQVLSGWPEARSVGGFVGVGSSGRVLLIAAGEDVGSEYERRVIGFFDRRLLGRS